MSIEKALGDLTEATRENTEVQKAILAKLNGEGGGEKEDRPSRRRGSKDEGDGEQEERPSRRRAKDDDDGEQDDRPSRRKSAKEEDDEPEERPSRRRGAKDEGEESSGNGRKNRKDAAGKPPKFSEVRAKLAAFLEVKSKKEEDARRDFLEDMFDAVGADKASDIPEDDFANVLKWLEEFAAGDDVKLPKPPKR